jgi:ethanolamine utilization cobalamin adenosyltransferase
MSKKVSSIKEQALRLKIVCDNLVTIALQTKLSTAKDLKKIIDDLKEIIKELENCE